YISGQGGREPGTNALAPTAEGQAARTLETIGAILEAGKLDFGHVAFANVYYPEAADLAGIDKSYMTKFQAGGAPSRGAINRSALPGGIKVELTFIASDEYDTRLYPPGAQPGTTESPASLANGTL